MIAPSPAPTVPDRLHLTDLEIATGMVLGQVPPVVDPDRGNAGLAPLVALERACLPALQAGPCFVSFSGGMDSTLVLAAALRVARREGLPDPVPVTWRFPAVPATDETGWQERILGRLGVRDQHILVGADELDLVGPVATRLMRAIGSFYPANLHTHLPIAELASGGSLLTGLGGDQVFLGPPVRAGQAPRRRAAWLPDPVRDRVRRRVGRDPYPWVSSRASIAVQQAERAEFRRTFVAAGFADRVAWQLGRRYLALTLADSARLGEATGVRIDHPLLDPVFLGSVLKTFGDATPPPRAEMFEVIAQGCDPVVWTKRPKARFTDVYLTDTSRRYAAAWAQRPDPTRLPSVVNSRVLARHWAQSPVPPESALLLQRCRLGDPEARPGC